MKNNHQILQHNARISNVALGEMLGIAPEEAAAEIAKLEEEGVIRGYSVILDDDKYDKSTVHATIELKITPHRDSGFDDIAKIIMMYDEVESVSLMSSTTAALAVEVKGSNLKDRCFLCLGASFNYRGRSLYLNSLHSQKIQGKRYLHRR